jgi:hypothetical protein
LQFPPSASPQRLRRELVRGELAIKVRDGSVKLDEALATVSAARKAFIVSNNVKRRYLNSGQRAMAVAMRSG